MKLFEALLIIIFIGLLVFLFVYAMTADPSPISQLLQSL